MSDDIRIKDCIENHGKYMLFLSTLSVVPDLQRPKAFEVTEHVECGFENLSHPEASASGP